MISFPMNPVLTLEIDVAGVLAVTVILAALSVLTGNWAREATRARHIFDDPITYIWYGNLAFMTLAFLFFPEYQLIDLQLGYLLAAVVSMGVFYPIGARYGKVNIQNYTHFTFSKDGRESIDPLSFIWYTILRKGKLIYCLQEEGLWATTKTLFGVHNALDFPFGAITRTHIRRSNRGKIKAAGCVAVSDIKFSETVIKKFGIIPIKYRRYIFVVGSHNLIPPQEYAVTTGVYKESVEIAESLNAENEGLRIDKEIAEIHGGVQTVKRLRKMRMDDDIREKAKVDAERERERRRGGGSDAK